MTIIPVESSVLATVAYNVDGELLLLEFRTRVVYCYFAVPSQVYEALLTATSKGSYFNQAIRGRYRFVRAGQERSASGATDATAVENERGAEVWPGL